MSDLPAVRIVWSGASTEICAVCGKPWPIETVTDEVPSAYTVASIDADDVPEPVCDLCVEQLDPETFEVLLAKRRVFRDN